MGVVVRGARPDDRDDLCGALVACGAFTSEEVGIAQQILDEALVAGPESGYTLFVADGEGRARGYVCVGRTPLTESTWHVYWICVDPAFQRKGVGRALQQHAEHAVAAAGGSRLVLETSGKPSYAPARVFYEQAGYAVVGRIPDYYRSGDDCVLYCKRLTD